MIDSTDRVDIRFDDGAAYERSMGVWSRLAGHAFLDWLALAAGLRWLDIGCGNGAFTELIVQRATPSSVQGVDPAEGQLAFARNRATTRLATFARGDAMALPCASARFDVAVMALVIVFLQDPPRGMSEMVRVLVPGGVAAAYVWDMVDGGFPLDPVLAAMRAMGLIHAVPPQAVASRIAPLRELWEAAGFEDVRTHVIPVERVFATFEDYWSAALASPTIAPVLARRATPEDGGRLRERVLASVARHDGGAVHIAARAHAVQGRKAA